MPNVGSVFSKLTSSKLARGFVLATYLASPLSNVKETEAALPPKEATKSVIRLADSSAQKVRVNGVETKQDKSIDWHNLISTFFIFDELDNKEIDNIKTDILLRGAADPSVPFNVLQTAICTTAKWAKSTNQNLDDLNLKHETLLAELDTLTEQEPTRAGKETERDNIVTSIGELLIRKQKMLDLISSYYGKVVVDFEANGKQERKSVALNELDEFLKSHEGAKTYDPLFPMQVNNVVAQLSNNNDQLEGIVSSFKSGSHDAQEVLIFLSGNSQVEFPKDVREYASNATLRNNGLVASNNSGGSSEIIDSSERNEISPYDLDFKSKIFYANNILLLALNNDPHAAEISQEWFKRRPPGKADEADFIALRALAICARNNKDAFNELGFVARTFPDVFDAYLFANNILQYNLKRAAGQEILDTFNANPANAKNAKNLLLDLARSSTGTSRTSAIVALSTMSDMTGNIDLLRGIISDSKSSEENKVAAMMGLARLRDKDSIEPLLKIAITESNDPGLRIKALETVLIIDTKDPIPASYREKVAKKYPLGLDLTFFDYYFKDGKVRKEFVDVALRDSRLEESVVTTLMKDLRYRFTYSNGYLAAMAKDKEHGQRFCSEFLDPLVLALNHSVSQGNFDFRLGIPAISALTNANYEKASPVILRCAVNPESCIKNTPKDQIFTGAQRHSANQTFLRAFAVESLGKVIPLDASGSDAAEKLFVLAGGGDPLFKDLALRGLLSLASRYQDQNAFNDIKNTYLNHALELLNKHREPRSIYTTRSMEWYAENKREFDLCNLIFKLGGGNNLARIALEDRNSPLTRSIINAFVVNNFTPERFNELKLNEPDAESFKTTYAFHSNKEYSLPKLNQIANGKGVTVAMIDGGIVMDMPGVTVPEHLITSFKLESKVPSLHSDVVAGIIKFAAGDCEVISGSWDHPTVLDPRMPEYLQGPEFQFLKWLIEGNLTGKHKVDVLAQSWGHKSYRFTEPDEREKIETYYALLEAAISAGIISFSSAGNDTGGYYGLTSFSPTGNLNVMGFRFNNGDNFSQIPGHFTVGAYDPLLGLPLPFSGTTDPLRPQQGTIVYVDGIFPARFYDGPRQMPATSFATPLAAALAARRIEIDRKKGLSDPSSAEINQAIFDSSDEIPGKIGRALDSRKFLSGDTSENRQLAP